ncbi:MAG TPA: hypothetical protein VGS07_26790 [Thermoanaerobaculia bacterium]|jgi:hypothetical protein|nr:hypothetical protein [Thermoanaerobaculia bacterium]
MEETQRSGQPKTEEPHDQRDDNEKDRKSDAEDKEEDFLRSRTEIQTGDVGGNAHLADTQNFFYGRVEGQDRKRLQSADLTRFSREDLERESDGLVFPRQALETLADRLKARRFLFLVGEPETGKATVARLLASRLQTGRLSPEVLFCSSPLDRTVEARFGDLADSRDCHNRVVIFKDVFALSNIDVNRFTSELNEAERDKHTKRLAANQAYFLFTSDVDRIASRERLSSLGLLCDLPTLPDDLLTQGLQFKVESLLTSRPEAKEQRESILILIAANGEKIIKKLRTMPRITRFVQEWLVKVAIGSLSLDQALEQMDDLGPWFLKSLPEDFETWSYVLALTLCYAAPASSEYVSWIHFDKFRQALTRFLNRELKRKFSERSPSCLCGEEELRRTTSIEIDEANGAAACYIRFREDVDLARLWKSLLGPGRQILGALMPALYDLLRSPEPSLRTTAARVLGRLGELDPQGIVAPLIWKLPGEDRFRRAEILGQILRGALGTTAAKYKAFCLGKLHAILSHPEVERSCIGILCVGELGASDPDLPLQEIRGALVSQLAWKFEDLGRLHRFIQAKERAAEKSAGTLKMEAQQTLRMIQAGNVDPLFSDPEREILKATYTALADYRFLPSIRELIDKLNEWSQEPDAPLAHLVTLIALSRNGLFDIFERFKENMVDQDDTELSHREECSSILYWTWRLGRGAAQRLGNYLETLYLRTSPFPGILRQALRKRWLALLKTWARQACSAAACRGTVIDLFDGLISAINPEVRQEVLHLLKFDPDFSKPGSDLEALAIEIITRTQAATRPLIPLATG